MQAATLARELGAVLDRLADGLGARGSHARAIEHARRRLALDPLHEPAHRRLIELYGASGERAAALEQYRDCVRMLHRELGVAPTEETTALYHAVREGSARPAAEPAAPRARRPARAATRSSGASASGARCSSAYGAVGPDGRLVVLDGETGIGKTRLADELVAWSRADAAVRGDRRAASRTRPSSPSAA